MSDDRSKLLTTEPLDETGGRALVEAWRVSGWGIKGPHHLVYLKT